MHLVPVNRHLVVEHVEDNSVEENVPTILLPSDVKIKTSPYSVVKLLQAHEASTLEEGSLLVVNSNMIDEVKFNNKTFLFLLENHVVGLLKS